MRLLVVLVSGALLLSGCSGGGEDSADTSADYVQAVATWRSTALEPAAAQATAARFSDVVVVGRRENARQLATQRARCAAVTSAREAVAALAPPVLDGGGTPEAQALSDRLVADTATYRDAVVAGLSEVASYCAYAARDQSLAGRKIVAERALKRTLTQRGVLSRSTRTEGQRIITTTVTCEAPAGCIPGRDRLPAYLAAYERARIDLVREQHQLNGGESTACRLSDYAGLCDAWSRGEAALVAAYQRVYDTVRRSRSTVDNPAIDQANTSATAAQRRFNATYAAAYRRTFPSVDQRATDYVTRNEVALLRRYEAAVRAAEVPDTTLPAPTAAPTG